MSALFITSNQSYLDSGSEDWSRLEMIAAKMNNVYVIVLLNSRSSTPPPTSNKSIFVFPVYSMFKWRQRSKVWDIVTANVIWNGAFVADVVVSDDPLDAGRVGEEIAVKFSKPWIINIYSDYWSSPHDAIPVDTILNKAYRICVNSTQIQEQMAKSVVGDFNRKFYRIPAFVDSSVMSHNDTGVDVKSRYTQFGYTILTAAPLEDHSNLQMAIHVVDRLRKLYPTLALMIVGSGHREMELKRLIYSLNLQNFVMIENSSDNLVAYMKSSNLYVCWSDSIGENDTNSITALSVGMVAVFPDCGFTRKYIVDEENALVAKSVTDQEYFYNIQRIIGHPQLQATLKLNSGTILAETAQSDNSDYQSLTENMWK